MTESDQFQGVLRHCPKWMTFDEPPSAGSDIAAYTGRTLDRFRTAIKSYKFTLDPTGLSTHGSGGRNQKSWPSDLANQRGTPWGLHENTLANVQPLKGSTIMDFRHTPENYKTPTNIKLASLWASVMFLYIYNDYFSMYTPGTVDGMAKGRLGPMGQATDAVLVGLSVMLAVPSLMICLSTILNSRLSRGLNVLFGLLYTVIEALTLFGSPLFYKIIVIAEIVLTALIVLYALRWPKNALPA